MIDCTGFVETLGDKPVAVFGLGISGLASVKALYAAGARVLAWDDCEASRDAARALGAEIRMLDKERLQECACLVLAPGVPLHFPEPHHVVKAAHAARVEILSDIEILHRVGHGRRVIGITGTNGKSTTTALIHHILDICDVPNAMGGNIGKAALGLDIPPENGVFVLEISSYQMDLCPTFKPDIAVLLNITPDHLDRHGSMENYEASKRRILSHDPAQVRIEHPVIDERVRVCTNMKGDHNLQNASAALLVCEALGLAETEILSAIQSFPGLNHRQFFVRRIGDVEYINDSKATNAEATAKALAAYETIYWIVGGRAKEGGLEGLEDFMGRVKHAFLIGESAKEFALWIKGHNVPYTMCGTLEKAVAAAYDTVHASGQNEGHDTILLSPACASWDQFTSFEARGDSFAALVKGLKA